MIRKQNSEFLTAFTSEAAKNLKNTDCFAHVELDGYACYVLADGIDDISGAKSARLCVDSVITSFTESPSMSKKALKKYIKTANEILKKQKSKKRLKASIMIVVHNYVKLRYVHAGNVRFRIYRNGFLKYESKDQSLSMDLAESGKLEKDMVIKHEERHNLYSYLGQDKEFSPKVSKKIKLTSTDAIALYTRGFWENVDDGEILDLFKDATDKPQETVNTAEDMLLSKQPKQLDAFSFVTIFVNKTFVDPNKKRRIKKILSILIPILIILLIIGIIVYNIYSTKQKNIALMNEKFANAIQYINDENYIRAQSMIEEAITYADKVNDTEITANATNYLMLIESVINADNNLTSKKYSAALSGFLIALDKSRYADNISNDYINEKLEETSAYIQVYDLISLGDNLTTNFLYSKAEQQYLNAKVLASKVYFDEGRQSAIQALEDLYSLMKEVESDNLTQASANLEKETTAVSFVAQADKAFASGEYEEALVFYTSALQKYQELDDILNAKLISDKISLTESKMSEADENKLVAIEYVLAAEESKLEQDYQLAIKYYELAKDIYEEIEDSAKTSEMEAKIEIIELLISMKEESDAQAEEQAKAEEEAQAQAEEEAQAESDAQSQALANKASAKECVSIADEAYDDEDYEKAIFFYNEALDKYTELEDLINIQDIESKIKQTQYILDYIEEQESIADEYISFADELRAEKEYDLAIKYYQFAKDIYNDLDNTNKVNQIQARIDVCNELKLEIIYEEETASTLNIMNTQIYNGYNSTGTYLGHNGFDNNGNYIGESGYNAKGENIGFGIFTKYGHFIGFSGYDKLGNYTGIGGYNLEGEYIGYTANGSKLN